MKVAYIFLTHGQGLYHLIHKILPQLMDGDLGLEVVGMCFFDNNAMILDPAHVYGKQLANLANEKQILLMKAETADLKLKERSYRAPGNLMNSQKHVKPTECTVIVMKQGEQIACFPDIYTALGSNRPDRIITL